MCRAEECFLFLIFWMSNAKLEMTDGMQMISYLISGLFKLLCQTSEFKVHRLNAQ